jgi:hypothetical protein
MSRVSVRHIIDDVPAAMRFHTTLLGFTVEHDASPAFAAVVRDGVRLLLSGDGSSGKRRMISSLGQPAHRSFSTTRRATQWEVFQPGR